MRIIFTLCISLLALSLNAQKDKATPYPKFGKITMEDLQRKVYSIDSQATAVVLKDYGSASIEGNAKGWFSFVTYRHKIVHILGKSGYDEANVVIPLYRDGSAEERISNIKAITYNLEGGKVVESKFDKDNMFIEKVNKSQTVRKFTMPNVKEGCIIEYEYKVTSDFIRSMDPWLFQGNHPVLWSEFEFSLPGFFSYAPQMRGYLPLTFTDRKDRTGSFQVIVSDVATASERYNFSAHISDLRWVMKDVPALVEESYTTSIKNHLSRMEFTLIAQGEPLSYVNYNRNWEQITKSLLESEYFGKYLKSDNYISDDIKPKFASSNNELEKAKSIFKYVRDNFSCSGEKGIWLDGSFKDIIKTKKGSVAEINLLLAGMLKNFGLNAEPVILSTRANGYVYDTYPTTKSYNYVVVLLKSDGNSYYLDASDPLVGFNYLLPYCYNGSARLIGENFEELSISAKDLKETSSTNVIISNDEKGKWSGRVTNIPGMYESYQIRNKIKEKGSDAYLKEVTENYGNEIKVTNVVVDSLKNLDMPLSISYNIDMNAGEENLIYINPLLNEAWKKNPFNSLKRSYPVEMSYAMDEVFYMTMEVPKGYEVDELPKQMMVKFDESGASFFEYRLTHSGNMISLRSRVKLVKAFFLPEEYEYLREFFGMIVQKHSEQIVFKKKK
jgi:hypothetical protein